MIIAEEPRPCDVKRLVGRSLDGGEGPDIVGKGFGIGRIAVTAERIGGKHSHQRRQVVLASFTDIQILWHHTFLPM